MTRPLVHFDISGPDESSLHHFYAELLDWEVRPMGPGYALIDTGDGSPNGAVVEAPSPSFVLGVAVPDLEAAVAEATGLGGRVVMPPTDNGFVKKAQVEDPAGNVLTFVEEDASGG
ncbi:MAG: VOC family protein [Actinomycetota bacterium]